MESTWQLFANFGFAALMCAVLFFAYRDLVKSQAGIIRENTQAMTELKGVIAALCDRFERMEKGV